MVKDNPTLLIIFGITGDLARRYLLPALGQIAKVGMIPDKFRIIGVTRKKDVDIDTILEKSKNKQYLRKHIELYVIDVTSKDEYEKLGEYLDKRDKKFGSIASRIFYLSVPPSASKDI